MKNLRIKRISALASLLPALLAATWLAAQELPGQPQPGESEDTARLQQQLDAIQSASGQFEQMIREADGYLIDRQTGTFSLQKPRLLRWDISELDQLLVSNGETLYLYDELFQQVTVRNWSSDPLVNPAALLLDDIWLGDWAAVSHSGESWLIEPFGRTTSIREIRLQMQQGFPSLLLLEDFSGQVTEIRFSQVEQNIDLDSSQFSFEIRAGTEVIYDEVGQ